MGLLRLFLALSIVCQHSGLNIGIGGGRAVEIFFMISGFYMGLILCSGKYKDYKLYITNRFLRILPIYWVVCLLILLISFTLSYSGWHSLSQTPLQAYSTYDSSLAFSTWLFLIFSNLCVFFQELSLFMGLDSGALYFTKHFQESSPMVYNFLLVPQAWSLGIELLFYTLAPFFLWKNAKASLYWLWVFVGLSFICKIVLLESGYSYDPWAYRFFPALLHLFLLGSLTYRFYVSTFFQNFCTQRQSILILQTGIFIVLGIGFRFGISPHIHLRIAKLIYESVIPYFFSAVLICLLFRLSSKNRLDRWLGELSYPLYTCHMMVISFTSMFVARSAFFPYLVVIISMLFSMALVRWVQRPIDKLRARRVATISVYHRDPSLGVVGHL